MCVLKRKCLQSFSILTVGVVQPGLYLLYESFSCLIGTTKTRLMFLKHIECCCWSFHLCCIHVLLRCLYFPSCRVAPLALVCTRAFKSGCGNNMEATNKMSCTVAQSFKKNSGAFTDTTEMLLFAFSSDMSRSIPFTLCPDVSLTDVPSE